jgi:hypothetical protein
MKVTGDLYDAILSDSSAGDKFEQQYDEIMEIIDPEGTGMVAQSVSTERLAEYLIPMLAAGKKSISAFQEVGQMEGKSEYSFYMYPRQLGGHFGTKVHCCYLKNRSVNNTIPGVADWYYTTNDLFYFNGYYLFENRVLNQPLADGALIQEEAEYIRDLNNRYVQDDFYGHYQTISAELNGESD